MNTAHNGTAMNPFLTYNGSRENINLKINDKEAKQIANGKEILKQAQPYMGELSKPYTDEELDSVLTEILTAP